VGIYDDVFAALDAVGVPYVVVGGVAVVLQGHARFTVELDLVIDLAVEPAAATVEALLSLGLRPRLPVDARDFADGAIRADWIATKNLQVFSMYDPDNPFREVDLFATHPIPFDQLLASSIAAVVGSASVRVASIPHLVEMKRAAGRPQDLADVEALLSIQGPQMTEPRNADWSTATHEGARAAMRREVALATPQARMVWLAQALELTLASGALAQAHQRRQAECDASWQRSS
jgi:hypothetical protein